MIKNQNRFFVTYLGLIGQHFPNQFLPDNEKEIKMCESCGCIPAENPVEEEVCSVCGKPKAECICESTE